MGGRKRGRLATQAAGRDEAETAATRAGDDGGLRSVGEARAQPRLPGDLSDVAAIELQRRSALPATRNHFLA